MTAAGGSVVAVRPGGWGSNEPGRFEVNASDDSQSAQLRRVAAAVEAAGVPVTVRIYLGPVNEYGASQPERVAVVEAVAAALGIAAETEIGALGWQRRARMTDEQVTVAVETRVAAPPDRCVCGMVCEHRPRLGWAS